MEYIYLRLVSDLSSFVLLSGSLNSVYLSISVVVCLSFLGYGICSLLKSLVLLSAIFFAGYRNFLISVRVAISSS